MDAATAWIAFGSAALGALVGAVVGGAITYFVQRRLNRDDQRRRLVVNYVEQLGATLHRLSFRRVDLMNGGTPDELHRLALGMVEALSALQAPQRFVRNWHPQASAAVNDWLNRNMQFYGQLILELKAGQNPDERIERALAHINQHQDDDLGLGDAMNALLDALDEEFGTSQE